MAISDFRVKLDVLKNSITQYCSTVLDKFTTLTTRFNAHEAQTGNVHNLEASDIGLTHVPDWSPATKKQAVDGVSNNTFMSAKRVDNYADANVYTVIGDAFKAAADEL